MRLRLMVVLWLISPSVFAGTVCQVQSTGQVVESYSVTQAEGHCQRNLLQLGFSVSDIAQLTVSESERMEMLNIWRQHPQNPDVVKQEQDHQQGTEQDIPVGVLGGTLGGALAALGISTLRGKKKEPA